jgi:hypothetical protein
MLGEPNPPENHMSRHLFSVLFCSLFTLALSGCGSVETDTSQTAASADVDEETIAAELARLSEDDRTAAIAQKVCPVGDGRLGAMGVPIKVELAGGKSAFVCCIGCVDPLQDNPEKYLAKLETDGEQTKQ